MNKEINMKAVGFGGLLIAGFVFLWFQAGLLPLNGGSQLGAVSSSKDAGTGLVTEVKGSEQPSTTVISGLVADYNFNVDLNDSTINHNNGAWVGTPAYDTAGRLGSRAISLTGTNYVSVPNNSSLNVGDNLSVSLWFKRGDTGQSGCEVLLSKGTNAYVPAIGGQSCVVPGSLNLCFAGIGCPVASSNTINDTSTWHHLVMTKSGSSRSIYIDNTNVTSLGTNYTGLTNSLKLFIGTDNNNDSPISYFKGSIDELHIYNRALSQSEVQTIFTEEGGVVAPQFALNVTKTGAGASEGTVTSSPVGISCGSTCSFNFNQNTTVTLTASAGTGSAFSGWSGACSGTGSCTVTMSQARDVTANFSAVATACSTLPGTSLPKLNVSNDGRFLTKQGSNQTPFFWLADTAWWLDNNLSDEDICYYLQKRADQGFTGIQMMGVLYHIELVHPWLQNPDDFNHQNPFNDSNFTIPGSFNYVQGASYPTNTQAYWNRIQWIVKQAEAKNLYVMIFPMWGKEVEPYFGGSGPASQAKEYNFGKFLGTTFSSNNNVLFSVSGEYDSINQYNPYIVTDAQFAMFNNLAQGIRDGDSTKLKTIHPGGAWSSVLQSNSVINKFTYPGTQTNWLDINMLQSGHQYFSNPNLRDQFENYVLIESGYNTTYPTQSTHKPIYDGEPFYEDLINGWYPLGDRNQPRANGAIERAKAYWDVFAGGLGHTYGHANVEVFWPIGYGVDPNLTEEPINWKDAINVDLANNAGKNAGAKSLKYLRQLVESKSSPSQYQPRMPDQGIIASGQPPCPDPVHISNPDPMKNPCGGHMQAMRENGPGGKGSYAFVYIPRTTTTAGTTNVGINMTKLTGQFATARWYDPTNGTYTNIPGSFPTNNTNLIFNSNTHPLLNGDGVDSLGGQNQDFVLVLESVTGGATVQPTSAFSRKTQGGNSYSLPLALTGTPTIEPRILPSSASSTHQMVINFADSVTVTGASVTTGIGSVSNWSAIGTQVVVNLTGVANQQNITVTLQNVNNGTSNNDVSVSMSMLAGDVNGDRTVDSVDLNSVRSKSGSSIDSSNYLYDVAVNGSINSGDVALITKRIGTQVTPINPPTMFDVETPSTPGCQVGDNFSRLTGEKCSTTTQLSSGTFTKNLGGGAQGDDVTSLQQYLVSHGYLNENGVTSFYGYQTIYAVQRLQASAGIPSTGYFGELTRAYVVSH